MRIARVRAGGRVYARTGGVILKMGKWGGTRSGRKERASEQREVLFGYHKAGDRREPTEGQGRGRPAAESGGEKRIPPLGGGEKGRKLYLWSVGALAASTRFSALVTRLSREVANSG